MIDQKTPAAIVNTGSKQGITCPPGDTAYNITKAGVKVLTEGLAHSLRNVKGCRVTAHLLVPGSTFTGMTARGRTEKPPGSWTPDQVIDVLVDRMGNGDFLHHLPRQRCHHRHRQSPDPVGSGGRHPQPPAAIALASRLRRRVRRVSRFAIAVPAG